jgi:SOS response regulatory protein OraA/RecX
MFLGRRKRFDDYHDLDAQIETTALRQCNLLDDGRRSARFMNERKRKKGKGRDQTKREAAREKIDLV